MSKNHCEITTSEVLCNVIALLDMNGMGNG
jgi:hypothetical protein